MFGMHGEFNMFGLSTMHCLSRDVNSCPGLILLINLLTILLSQMREDEIKMRYDGINVVLCIHLSCQLCYERLFV